MSKLNFDAIVIGAGPAGSSAAYQLATHGMRVCIIDRAIFPRDKLCGGLVTQRSQKMFERTFERKLDNSLYLTSAHIAFVMRDELLQEHNGYSDMHFVMRRAFDHHLLGLAQSQGITTFTHTVVTDIDLIAHTITTQDGKTLTYKFLVGADGVNSQVSKAVLGASIDLQTVGFAMEVEVPRAEFPAYGDRVEIDFGVVNWGYGWCFPKQDSITVGVGGLHKKNPLLKQSMHDYLRLKGLDPAHYKIKGHHIPFGDYKKTPGKLNVLLVGDAAGVVDPITGEGIAYAIETGEQAAQAIAAAFKQGSADAMHYYQPKFNVIISDIRAANFWRKLIFPRFVFKYFSSAFSQAITLQKGFLDIMAGHHGYSKLPYLFCLQFGQGIKRRFKKFWLKSG